MKKATLLFVILCFSMAQAQTPVGDHLDINNIKARFNADGSLFNNYGTSFLQGFEAPKGSGIHTFFASGVWMGGYDASNNLKLAAQTYKQQGTDFFPGPLDSLGTTDSLTMLAYNKVWKINKCTIDSFVVYCQTGLPANYIVPNVIKTWPGISSFGLPLAPFHDANNDGLYNTDSCDYPLIKGDQAIFFVFNDAGGTHTESNGGIIGAEIQAMAYSYNCKNDSALYNTIFTNYKVINRSATSIDTVFIGNWSDFDIGAYNDDYVGSDVTRSAFYGYNGDAIDGPAVGNQLAYGSAPAAQAVVFLRGPLADADGIDNAANTTPNGYGYGDATIDNERLGLSNFIYYDNSFSPTNGHPTAADDYFQYLTSSWKNAQPVTYGANGTTGSVNAKYMYPGTSDPLGFGTGMVPQAAWDETSAGNVPSDRRGLGSSGPFKLNAGATQEIDFAYVFARAGANVLINSVSLMQIRIDSIRTKFNKGITPCGCASATGIASIKNNNTFNFYPNPASDILTINYSGNAKEYSISIFDIAGKLIKQMDNVSNNTTIINLDDVEKGMYLISIFDGELVSTKKFVRQ